MAELTRLTDPAQSTYNTKVMGMTEENTIFKGIVINVISYNDMVPSEMTVKGTTYNGKYHVSFIKDMLLSRLKIYDENEYSKLKELMFKRAEAFDTAEHCLKLCRRILI